MEELLERFQLPEGGTAWDEFSGAERDAPSWHLSGTEPQAVRALRQNWSHCRNGMRGDELIRGVGRKRGTGSPNNLSLSMFHPVTYGTYPRPSLSELTLRPRQEYPVDSFAQVEHLGAVPYVTDKG